MRDEKVFRKNELEANKQLITGCLISAAIIFIVWILFLTKIIPQRSYIFVVSGLPINIIVLVIPFFLRRTKFVESKSFKYFLLAAFSICILNINIIVPKHGMIAWAAIIVLATHYYSPKVTSIMTAITIGLIAVSIPCGMLIGEWDANLLGVSEEAFNNMTINGHAANGNNPEDRLYWLTHFSEFSATTNRFIAAFGFYFLARVFCVLVTGTLAIQYTKRSNKLLKEEANVIAEKQKIDLDLNVARDIQMNALPTVFPNMNEFDVFAKMVPAKEVGGDFYDLYKINGTKIGLTIADVSGKGVPAAMFMMKAKSLMKAEVCVQDDLAFAITQTNKELCKGNTNGMFVTAFTATLELTTGVVNLANAGHNPILIRHHQSRFEYFRCPKSFVLGGLDSIDYKMIENKLVPGDTVVLYTDGVTEAMNEAGELYGEKRLCDFLNTLQVSLKAEEVVNLIYEDVKKFAGNAEQADDITLMVFNYFGPKATELMVESKRENVEQVIDFIDAKLKEEDADEKLITQMNVAIDEIYSNIAKYAFDGQIGEITTQVRFYEGYVLVTFKDNGKEFNPLERDDPNTSLGSDEREIGGLGIFIVKKTMDTVTYDRVDGYNYLTIVKKIK